MLLEKNTSTKKVPELMKANRRTPLLPPASTALRERAMAGGLRFRVRTRVFQGRTRSRLAACR